MSFTTIKLANSQVLITGADYRGVDGELVIDGTQWDELNQRSDHDLAHAAFDEAVRAFYAPLEEATALLEATHATVNSDPLFHVVLNEAVEATEGRPEEVVVLTNDSVILRLIEQDPATDRLIWVKDQLVVTAGSATFPSVADNEVPAAEAATPVFDGLSAGAEGSEPTA